MLSFKGKLKDGEIMIKEFTANGYKYVLAGPVLVVSKVKLNGVDIDMFKAEYDERRRLQEVLTQIFGTTAFADKLSEIQEVLEHGDSKKVIYLDSLHRFGRKQGLEIYDRLKPVLHQQA